MKDLMFGIAVGAVIGAVLYKNNDCTKKIVDEGQKIVESEMDKMQNPKNVKK